MECGTFSSSMERPFVVKNIPLAWDVDANPGRSAIIGTRLIVEESPK
jgi:hypothetical protein